jgi:hypothetical protein
MTSAFSTTLSAWCDDQIRILRRERLAIILRSDDMALVYRHAIDRALRKSQETYAAFGSVTWTKEEHAVITMVAARWAIRLWKYNRAYRKKHGITKT